MKRISVALLLTLLGSTAHASGYSFSIGGHNIHVEAGRHCRSLSCVSWSEAGSRRSYRDDDEVATPAPAKPVAPACAPVVAPAPAAATPVAPAPIAPPIPAPPPAPVRAQLAPAPVVQPAPVQVPVQAPVKPTRVVQTPAPSTIELAAANTQPVMKPDTGKPKEKATVEATVTDKPVETPDWAKDWSPPKDTPARARTAEKPIKAVVAYEDASPVGDWQTEGKKGLVRIEQCGAAFCGYILNDATNTTAETVLSNMKLKTGTQWAGDIYSRASGNTYYAKMTFKQPDILRVEACAIGRFFCSGNDWTRVPRPDEVAISRHLPAAPKSKS